MRASRRSLAADAPPRTGGPSAHRSLRPPRRRCDGVAAALRPERETRGRRWPSLRRQPRSCPPPPPCCERTPCGASRGTSEPRRREAAEAGCPRLRRNLVLRHPVVDRRPVEVVEERVDIRRAIGLVVEEVGVLVDVERDQRRRVPDRERVLRVADVVEEPTFVPVIRRPRPATPC